MAGIYPDVPSPQVLYDRDGSTGFSIDSGNNITQFTQTDLDNLNGLTDVSVIAIGQQSSGRYAGLIFSSLIDLKGYFLAGRVDDPNQSEWNDLRYSTDTTNGLDGTWTVLRASGLGRNGLITPAFRTGIQTQVINGIKALRFYMPGTGSGEGSYFKKFHVYGVISSGQVLDRLRLWNPTTDVELLGPAFDLGDVARGVTTEIPFRIKNNSASLSANGIIISASALSDATPSVVSGMSFNYDGGSFSPSINIGNLAPGVISNTVRLKLQLGSTAALSTWRQRVVAAASSWT